MKLTAETAKVGQVWLSGAGRKFTITWIGGGWFREESSKVWADHDFGARWTSTCTLVADVDPWIDHTVELPSGEYEWARSGEPLGAGAEHFCAEIRKWQPLASHTLTPEAWIRSWGVRLLAVRKKRPALDIPEAEPRAAECAQCNGFDPDACSACARGRQRAAESEPNPDTLECPCCGCTGAVAHPDGLFYEDDPLVCGCDGNIGIDGETAYVSAYECDCNGDGFRPAGSITGRPYRSREERDSALLTVPQNDTWRPSSKERLKANIRERGRALILICTGERDSSWMRGGEDHDERLAVDTQHEDFV